MNPDWRERTALLLGEGALRRMERARVLVVGLGGVGGIAVEMIARAGVGNLVIADGDVVEDSNRNRQIVALTGTVGRTKAAVMEERLRGINPDLNLTVFDRFFSAEEMDSLAAGGDDGPFDCVLDAIDTTAPKIALLSAALNRMIPVVSCMGSGARLDPEKITCVPVMKTFGCPLAKVVRSGLRGLDPEKLKLCRAVFSAEPPVEGAVFDPGVMKNNKRSVIGTVSYMPAMFGCRCAAEVVNLLKKEPSA